MKTVLVSYPTWTGVTDDALGIRNEQLSQDYPVGVLTLVAALRQAGLEVEFLNSDRWLQSYSQTNTFDKLTAIEKLASDLAKSEAEIYGFSALNQSYPFSLLVAERLRQIRPNATIVFGGPQATATAEQSMSEFSFIDFILCNEADTTFPSLLQALKADADVTEVPGLWYRARGRPNRTLGAGFIEDLDIIPLPAYDLIEADALSLKISLEAGRGCPYGCRFCVTNTQFSRLFRVKSPPHLVAQMVELYQRYGSWRFTFIHDLMVVSRKWVFELCRAIEESELPEKVTWGCSARSDLVDEELLSAMARAGCDGIYYGIETGSQRMQEVLNKNLNLDSLIPVLEATREVGIACTTSFITGFPDERPDDQQDTLNRVVETQRFEGVRGQLHIFSTYSNTPYFDDYKDKLSFVPHLHPDSAFMPTLIAEERQLITSYPLIFSNFYVYEHGLDPDRTKRLQVFFILGTLARHRIIVALKDKVGCFVRAFEQWEHHLARQGLFQDTNELVNLAVGESVFLLRTYLDIVHEIWGQDDPALASLVQLALSKIEVLRFSISGQSRKGDRPSVVSHGRLLILDRNPHAVIENICRSPSRATRPDSSLKSAVAFFLKKEAKNRLGIYELSDVCAKLIQNCNGEMNAEELSRSVELPEMGLPQSALVEVGLDSLYQQGFITYV